MRTAFLACCVWLGCLSLDASLVAQDAKIKPVIVTAMAPIDDLLADSDYLTGVFGAEETGKMVRQAVGPYLGGIDRKRPWGAYVTLVDEQPVAVGFIPVTSLEVQLKILEEQIGKAEKLPGGVFKVALPPTPGEEMAEPRDLFLREQDGWAFYSDSADNLASLPKDPVALLGGLEKKYDFGTRFLVENVSAEDRQKFIDELKKQIEEARANPDAEAPDVPEEWMRSFEEMVLKYAEGTRSIDVGFSVDAKNANIAIALAVEPIAGSELAKSLESVKSLKTSHAGVLVPGSAVVVHRAARLSKEDVAVWDVFIDEMLQEAQENPAEPIENEELAKDGQALAEKFLKGSYADGQVDWGLSYLINDEGKLTMIGGSHIVGLKQLEADFRALLAKYKDDPKLEDVKVEWDFARHGDVRIVRFQPPADAAERPELFGDDRSLYLGLDGDYLYLAAGEGALQQLEDAIDRSKAKPDFKAAPYRQRIDVRPLVKLAVKTIGSDNPLVDSLVKKLEASAGKTSINVNLLPGENGLEGRFEIGEGVLTIMPEVGQLIWQQVMNANLDPDAAAEPGAPFDAPAIPDAAPPPLPQP